MLRLLGIVISIGLADSLNPTTIAPALYLASGEHARTRVLEFTLAVFLVYLAGGLAIALGPGQLLLSLIPHPHHRAAYVIELGAGVAMLAAALLLWRHRARLTAREQPQFDARGRSSWVLGATITAIELPTAFPYFAAIATVVGDGGSITRQVFLLVIFNVCFVLPLIGILLTLALAGDRAARLLGAGRDFLQAHWPRLLAGAGILVGVFVILLGASGLASTHNDFGQFLHRIRRHLVHPLK
ncbi:MAG TPA: GAP family protein [Solirubrobacteraceae bacterium]|nr:GAP family protein [Solirubrobacteraceae bacterium]